MADKAPSPEASPTENFVGPKFGSPEIPTTYANISVVSINASDVSIYFGMRADGIADPHGRFEHRVVVSHASFMKMVEFWATRYSALKTIYEESPMSLDDFERSKVDMAFKAMIAAFGPAQDDEQDDDENG